MTAGLLPGRLALRIDPLLALRAELLQDLSTNKDALRSHIQELTSNYQELRSNKQERRRQCNQIPPRLLLDSLLVLLVTSGARFLDRQIEQRPQSRAGDIPGECGDQPQPSMQAA